MFKPDRRVAAGARKEQPTPSSVAQAEAHSKGDVARILEQAKALDGQGKEGECMAAVAKARLILNP